MILNLKASHYFNKMDCVVMHYFNMGSILMQEQADME